MSKHVPALPNDVVQLNGSRRRGRVLDWATQLPLNQRTLGGTHLAIQPVDDDGLDSGPVVFWPPRQVTVVAEGYRPPPTYHHDPEAFRF